MHSDNSEIKFPSNLFSTKVFKCNEENSLDAWSFLISLKNMLVHQLNKKKFKNDDKVIFNSRITHD